MRVGTKEDMVRAAYMATLLVPKPEVSTWQRWGWRVVREYGEYVVMRRVIR